MQSKYKCRRDNLKNRVSSKDVAKEAGVSQATVSYVLNNTKGISIKQETKDAVTAAAKKLNYHPNISAKGMKTKKAYSIGVMSDKDMSSYVFMSVLEGVRDYFSKKSYSITFCSNEYDDFTRSECINYYNSNRIDGVLLAYINIASSDIEYLTDNDIPFTIINPRIDYDTPNKVTISMESALIEGIAHLKSNGIREIGFMGSHAFNMSSNRYTAFIHSMNVNDLPVNENFIFHTKCGGSDFEAYLGERFPMGKHLPRGLICDSTNSAIYFLRYAYRQKLLLPEDIALISIGTSQFAPRSCPALSTVEAPLYETGAKSAEMLFNIINSLENVKPLVMNWIFINRET